MQNNKAHFVSKVIVPFWNVEIVKYMKILIELFTNWANSFKTSESLLSKTGCMIGSFLKMENL